MLVTLTAAFPDFKIEIKDMIQESNKVVVRSEISGTQAGPFMEFESKGQKIVIALIATK